MYASPDLLEKLLLIKLWMGRLTKVKLSGFTKNRFKVQQIKNNYLENNKQLKLDQKPATSLLPALEDTIIPYPASNNSNM